MKPHARELIRSWIEENFDFSSSTNLPTKVGKNAVRRLTGYEYNNTIRDLFGIDFSLEQQLQPDNSNGGFNNFAALNTVSPERLSQYRLAAKFVAETVLGLNEYLLFKTKTWGAESFYWKNPV